MTRFLIMVILCTSQTACYYTQAASGQWEVLRKRESIEKIIDDPETPPALVERLRLLDEARDFSIEVLGLPDNKSYRTYTDLERDYVVWNVFAAPEFSLLPKTWCYPVAGCVSYRGYFSKDDAMKEAERLKQEGFDVAMAGVAAYSTLGKFNDPVLSTMMRWDDIDLIAVLIHELAHQLVYVKDDSAFNESFATAVEEIGVRLWLESRGEMETMADYVAGRELQRNGKEAGGWLSGELNNARLISTTLYEGKLPAFRALYRRCEENLACFYEEANRLADLNAAEREIALSAGDLLYLSGGMNEQ